MTVIECSQQNDTLWFYFPQANKGGTSRHAGDADKAEENCTITVQSAMTI